MFRCLLCLRPLHKEGDLGCNKMTHYMGFIVKERNTLAFQGTA